MNKRNEDCHQMQLNNIELVSVLPGLDCAIQIGISLRSTTQFPLPLRLDRAQVPRNWQQNEN